ncbi:putative outermembrane lipoprotein [Vibrio parahaemolyticus VP232]|nr:putative outermembrane lipoprotein [Vibrio parahaemolyticus VP232]
MPSHVTHAQSQDVHIRIDGQFNLSDANTKVKSLEVRAIGITTFS